MVGTVGCIAGDPAGIGRVETVVADDDADGFDEDGHGQDP
jgi:hypothetical protein